MKSDQQQIKKAVEQMGNSLKENDEITKQTQEAIKKATRKGATAKDALGLTDAMVEGIYGQAYRLYNTGKYKDASQLFRLLIMLNTLESKYPMGLAACFHMLKEFKSAIEIYTMVSVIDHESPIPFYHASDCYIQMGDPGSAIMVLEIAIKRAENKAEFHTLKERASMTIESLKKELNKNKE